MLGNKFICTIFGIDDAAFASLVGAGVSAISSGGQAIANSKLNKKNRQWQEKMYGIKLADQRIDTAAARAWQEEQIEKQNKYSSPANQVKLLKEAGLNPALAYGGNTSNASTAVAGGQATQAAPEVGSPQTFGYDFSGIAQAGDNVVKNLLDSARLHNESKLTEADIELKKAESLKNLQDAHLSSEQAKLTGLDVDYKRRTLEQRVQLVDQQVEKTKVEIATANYQLSSIFPEQAALLAAQTDHFLNSAMHELYKIAETEANTSLSYEKQKFLREDTMRVRLDNELQPLRATYMELNNQLTAEQQAYLYRLKSKTISDTERTEAETRLIETQTKMYKLNSWFSNISGAFSSLMVGAAAGTQAYDVMRGLFKKVPKIGFGLSLPVATPGTFPNYSIYDSSRQMH